MKFADLFGKYRFYFTRGWFYFSIVQTIVIFLIGLKVFYEYLVKLNIPMELIYLAMVLAVFLIPPLIGIFEFKRIGHVESQLAWEITPATIKLCKEVQEIHERLCGDDGK